MRPWAVLLCLGLVLLLTSPGAEAKRFDPSMVDPLSRRSTLDKNFMRFGRSSPSFTEEDETKDAGDSLSTSGTNKEDNFLRSMRGKDNFIRFGRARNDNFMRFGRGKQDNFMRFGKSLDDSLIRDIRGKQDSYMRFGRGKEGNFMRFGRGKQDNYMRFGRSKQDNYMRFGRGKQDNFMRLGRGKHDNFLRFGRGKQDSYMRFGRNYEVDPTSYLPQMLDHDKTTQTSVLEELNGKPDDFIKFGGSLADEMDVPIPIAMRSSDRNLMRFGRARQDNFMRFGKSEEKINSLPLSEQMMENKEQVQDNAHYTQSPSSFERETKSKDSNMIRFGRHPLNKDDGFMRFGRNSEEQTVTLSEPELIPPRLKRSVSNVYDSQDDFLPPKQQDDLYNHILIPLSTLPDDFEEEFLPQQQQDEYTNRKKRSVSHHPTSPPSSIEENRSVDYISAKFRFDSPSKPDYQASLLSAGLPNVIVGPEFSLLPDLDPPSNMLKRGPGDQSFLRLG